MAIIGSRLSSFLFDKKRQLAAKYRHIRTPPYRLGSGQPFGSIPMLSGAQCCENLHRRSGLDAWL
jgi:hypothetical protein